MVSNRKVRSNSDKKKCYRFSSKPETGQDKLTILLKRINKTIVLAANLGQAKNLPATAPTLINNTIVLAANVGQAKNLPAIPPTLINNTIVLAVNLRPTKTRHCQPLL